MKVIYIADDGKEFDDEFECMDYEWLLNHPNLKDVKIYDKRNGELFNDIMSSDDAYQYGDKVIIPTELALKEFHDWAEYGGYHDARQITEIGTWIYNDDKNKYEKVGE